MFVCFFPCEPTFQLVRQYDGAFFPHWATREAAIYSTQVSLSSTLKQPPLPTKCWTWSKKESIEQQTRKQSIHNKDSRKHQNQSNYRTTNNNEFGSSEEVRWGPGHCSIWKTNKNNVLSRTFLTWSFCIQTRAKNGGAAPPCGRRRSSQKEAAAAVLFLRTGSQPDPTTIATHTECASSPGAFRALLGTLLGRTAFRDRRSETMRPAKRRRSSAHAVTSSIFS